MIARWLPLMFCSLAFAQPYVNYRGVVNVASYMAPGLPAGSLAQGGMVAIFGRNLGPAAGVPATAFPLDTTLSGVSLTVTQKSTTVNAYPVYVGAGQINAIIPSNTPLGRATIQVTVNGVASNPSPVNVVAASFGAFSVKVRPSRLGRNPRTGAEVSIPPGKAVRFKPGKELQTLQ